MKTPCWTFLLSVSTAAATYGQATGGNTSITAAAGANPIQTEPTPYTVVERGANHRVWQKATYETLPSGRVVPHIHKYTELATGMHYLQSGQWMEAREEIYPCLGGAIATNGQHKVVFSTDLNAAVVVDMQTPDGKRLQSHVLGLSYFDTGTGSNVWIAEVKSSIGELQASNSIVYGDAFTGVKADVRYTYRKSGLEQDIILREQPPAPEAYGLNPKTTWLQVFTEFVNSPDPEILPRTGKSNSQDDEDLDFGAILIGRGKAFDLGNESPSDKVPVHKQYLIMDGRRVLVEEVPLNAVRAGLEKLPLHAQVKQSKSFRIASRGRVLPKAPPAQTSSQPLKMARALPVRKGYVLDYVTLNIGHTNYVFQGDTTYYISDEVVLRGTTTIEGGTILKYSSSASAYLNVQGPVDCQTDSYRPAIFTAVDDDSQGEAIAGSTGIPSGYYGGAAMYVDTGSTLELKCIRAAYLGIVFSLSNDSEIWNMQCVNCAYVFGIGTDNCRLTINNGLFSGIQRLFSVQDTWQVSGTQLTIHNCAFLADALANISLTNSLLVNVTNWADGGDLSALVTNSVAFLTNDSGIFQSVGAGKHYLANNSSYRNAGTTNIDTAVLADIISKTTYPPIVISNVTISVSTNFGIQAQRNTGTPDLGFHYDPIDYFFGGVTAFANLTFSPGTAVGWFESPDDSIVLGDDVTVTFNGTVTSPCTFARYETVQEGGNGLWTAKGVYGGILGEGNYYTVHPSHIAATFTRFASTAGDPSPYRDYAGILGVIATHCEIWSGGLGGYVTQSYYTNCLLDRVGLWQGANADPPVMVFRNTTFHGGSLTFAHWEGGSPYWYSSIRDCAFDGTVITMDYADPAYTDYAFNAYLQGATQTYPAGTNNVTLTNSFNWQTGWLGNFYLPANSPLIDRGSRTADQARLYHFTTQTDQIVETNSTVDIGYHYVATDEDGNPIDTDGDGIPDYFDDFCDGHHISAVSCVLSGQVVDSGALSYITTNIFSGGSISPPTLARDVSFSAGLQQYWVSFDCDAAFNHYGTNAVAYTAGDLFFSSAIPSSFPNPGIYTYTAQVYGTASNSACSNVVATVGTLTVNVLGNEDSDYDGICGSEEISDGTNPTDWASVLPVKLGHWRFDNTNTWIGQQGQLPLSSANITGVPSWNTNAVKITATNAVLAFRDVETNSCRANINLHTGTIRFWFKPDWGSTNAGGVGPQTDGRLIEVGSKGTTNGWWALVIDQAGTNIYFGTQTNSILTLATNFAAPISWSSNIWHQIVLTYSTGNSSLYLDGQSVNTTGSGVVCWPGATVRAQGFTIGSSISATNQTKGTFDELETFNYALDGALIQSDYQTSISRDSDGDGWPDIVEDFLGTNPYNPSSFPPGITIDQPANASVISR